MRTPPPPHPQSIRDIYTYNFANKRIGGYEAVRQQFSEKINITHGLNVHGFLPHIRPSFRIGPALNASHHVGLTCYVSLIRSYAWAGRVYSPPNLGFCCNTWSLDRIFRYSDKKTHLSLLDCAGGLQYAFCFKPAAPSRLSWTPPG